jgi:hypothetical protein
MDNWLANMVGDVDSLHVEINNLNDPLMGFCFIRSIDNANHHSLYTWVNLHLYNCIHKNDRLANFFFIQVK